MRRPHLAWPRLKGNVSLTARAASESGHCDLLPSLLPPLGGGTGKQIRWPLFGHSLSGHTLTKAGILEIPITKTVVFPLLSLLGLYALCSGSWSQVFVM